MVVINFAHPLTSRQQAQVETLTGQAVSTVLETPWQFEHDVSFTAQVATQLEALALSTAAWQSESILSNPPGYAPITAVLLAELHGRMGHFPAIIRTRPVPDMTPSQYDVAEIINVQAVRDTVRRQRATP